MTSVLRSSRHTVCGLLLGLIAGLTLSASAAAQGLLDPGLPSPGALEFSFQAPLPRQATLVEWDGKPLPGGRNYVDGPVFVDWNRLNLTWWFKWMPTAGSSVTKVRWEVSKYPFPDGAFVPEPGFGMVGEESSLQFFVDLGSLAPRPASWNPTLTSSSSQKPVTTVSPEPFFLPPTASPIARLTRTTSARFPGASMPPFANANVVAFLAQSDPVVAQSTSLYTRVIPWGPDGALGPPSNVVVLNFGEPDPAGVINIPKIVFPTASLAVYKAARPYAFDWKCHVIATMDVPLLGYVKGDAIDVCGDDSGEVLSDIADAFGGFLSLLADFVNWASGAYSAIKAEVASAVSGALTTFGIPCNPSCASFALNTALVAVGMPPELPDVEQLQAMGEGHLVNTVADYATTQTGVPVPDAAREEIRQQMHDMIEKATANATGGGSGSALYIPDRSFQFHGPIVAMDIKNSDPTTSSVPSMLELQDTTGRYHSGVYFIPALRPGATVRIALTLKPKDDPGAWMGLLPASGDVGLDVVVAKMLAAQDALNGWKADYLGAPLTLHATVGVYGQFTRTCSASLSSCP